MAAPKMTRHEMKQDELVSAVEKAGQYLSQNPTLIRNWGIGLVAAVVLIVVVSTVLKSRAAASAELLREGQARFSAQVVPGAMVRSDDVNPTYPSEAERDRAALESFNKLVSSYSGRAAGRIGLYYQGILLARLGRPQEAEAAFSRFVEKPTSPALAALAKSQLAQLRAQRGDLDGAAKIYSDMAEDARGAYPRDFALFYLAQTLDQQGKRAEAAATYRKLMSEFPTSPLALEAGRKVEGSATS